MIYRIFKKLVRKESNFVAVMLCIAGVLLNLVLNLLVTAFELPLYLDTVGTVAVAGMGGYLPGVTVGFITNIFKTIYNQQSMYYGALNVLIAVFTALFFSRGWHKKIFGIVGMILLFTFIGGGIGAFIPLFLNGLVFDAESLFGVLYNTGFFSVESSYFLSSLIMELPDKVITVIMALGIVYLIPQGYHSSFTFHMWMQNPAESEAVSRQGKAGVRCISLRVKALIVLGFALTTVSAVGIILSVQVFNNNLISEHTQLAYGTANMTASFIDGDRVDEYLKNSYESRDYKETKKLLETVYRGSPEVKFLYVYRVEQDGFRVIFDFDAEGVPAGEKGSLVDIDPGFLPYMDKLLSGEKIDPIMTNAQYGPLLTVAEPVYDSDGRCVCYAIADVDMGHLNSSSQSFLAEIISVFLAYFILLGVFAMWLTRFHILIPINSIVKCMDEITHAAEDSTGIEEGLRNLRRLGIHTGDELETLYTSACNMTKNQVEHMRSIRRLSDSTLKMQDGLIITMADMVENRDSDTGAHIQKTAAYVKIIAEGLKRKGYYPEKLTPKFMSDVVRSAPLHDIGKIFVPDEVLNKPGKLTDEEYEIMKTHTTAGKKIVEKAINTVEGDNYLKEARNMAAYHHERWDGKGYPEGIHGEVIPLSARIMAVADVFDALTSQRVYKPAVSLEKALEILEEGKGTQFDPKCVEAFMDSLPEIKVILRKYKAEG